jgi:hypothetical protein
MRVSTSAPHGKKVVSITPIIRGFQSYAAAVSTNPPEATVVQLNVRTIERHRVEILSEDRTLRSRSNEQLTCAIIPDAALFQTLVSQWHKERGATSSITQMAVCPSYQQIIGMGDKAVPLILRQIENEVDDPDHWFWALQAITRANPVPEDARGDMREMARVWLDWAYMEGYDW